MPQSPSSANHPARPFLSIRTGALRRLVVPVLVSAALGACSRSDQPVAVVPLPSDGSPAVLVTNIGTQQYQLAFDTGTTYNTIDARAASAHGLTPLDDEQIRQLERYREPLPTVTNLLGGADARLQYYRVPSMRYGRWSPQSGGLVSGISTSAFANISTDRVRIDGVLGMQSLATLNWMWNHEAGRLEGYRFGSTRFAEQRDGMTCTALSITPSGVPVIELDLEGWGSVGFLVDTGFISDHGGTLSLADVALLRHVKALSGEVSAPAQKGMDPVTLVQVKTARLADIKFDGLVFDQIPLASARVGIGFLNRFDRVAFDFEKLRFCFTAGKEIAPDTLPTAAEVAANIAGK